MRQTPLDSAGRRAAAYWFSDGLPEIVAGTGLAALGGGLLWFHRNRPDAIQDRLLYILPLLAVVVLVFTFQRSINLYLKSRVTFPRTGYVRPPTQEAPQTEGLTTLELKGQPQRPPSENVTRFRYVVVNLLICGFALGGAFEQPVGIPIALTVLAVLLYTGSRNSERPYHWASMLLLPLMGLFVMPLSLNGRGNSAAALLVGGAWLAGQGLWRLVFYLRLHPKPRTLEELHP